MSKASNTTLKSFFETGDVPVQSNFEDLIDSVSNLDSDAWEIDTSGVSDTSTELQALFDAASDGDTVFLPKGTIYLTTSVTVTKKIKIVGQGTTIKLTTGIKGLSFDVDDITIENVDFQYITGTKNSSQYGIFVNSKKQL